MDFDINNVCQNLFMNRKVTKLLVLVLRSTKNSALDFICYNQILIELKALNQLTSEHESQIINYLKATNLKVGFLFNFGEKSLKYKRFIL